MSKNLERYSALTRLVQSCEQGAPAMVKHLQNKFSDPRLDIRLVPYGEGDHPPKKWVILRWVDSKEVFRKARSEECADFNYPMTLFSSSKERIEWSDIALLKWLPDDRERAKQLDDQAWAEEQAEEKSGKELVYQFKEARTMNQLEPTIGPALDTTYKHATEKSPHGYYVIDRRSQRLAEEKGDGV